MSLPHEYEFDARKPSIEAQARSTALCQWLREHSSGAYRKAAEAADRIEELEAALSRKAEQPAEADINGLLAEIEAQPGGKGEVAKAREWAREQIAEMGARAEEYNPSTEVFAYAMKQVEDELAPALKLMTGKAIEPDEQLVDMATRVWFGPEHASSAQAEELPKQWHERTEKIADLRAIAADRASRAQQFCDTHCTWRDHHPDCERAEQPAEAQDLPPLQKLAAYPLEDFAKEGKPAGYPLFGANDWKLTVGDVLAARAAIAADRASRAVEAQGEGLTELAALKERVELVHRLCCGTAPKQSVGELIAVALKMPEWDTIAAHLRAAGRAALSDDAIFAAMKPHMLMADGGYVCDTASEHVIAAGKALLQAACVSAAGQGGDGEGLDWLDSQGVAYGFEDLHEGNRWEINGPFPNLRAAIDAAKAKAEEQQG